MAKILEFKKKNSISYIKLDFQIYLSTRNIKNCSSACGFSRSTGAKDKNHENICKCILFDELLKFRRSIREYKRCKRCVEIFGYSKNDEDSA